MPNGTRFERTSELKISCSNFWVYYFRLNAASVLPCCSLYCKYIIIIIIIWLNFKWGLPDSSCTTIRHNTQTFTCHKITHHAHTKHSTQSYRNNEGHITHNEYNTRAHTDTHTHTHKVKLSCNRPLACIVLRYSVCAHRLWYSLH
jgi:hypothetical protein